MMWWLLLALLAGVAAPAGAAEWEMRVTDDAAVTLLHRQAPVVTSHYVFWGADWKWAGASLRLGQPGPEGIPFAGEVKELGLTLAGSVARPQPNVLRFTYRIEAARDLEGIIGGGLEFGLKLNAPSLGPKPAEPALLEGNRGWRWEPAPRQVLTVAFEPAIANVYFERGQKSTLRAMLVGNTLAAGAHTLTMTVSLPEGGAVVPSPGERYGAADTSGWYPDALPWNTSPVDLSFLNAGERPAGKRGFVRAEGDRLLFADGTPARFWGANLAAYALFSDKDAVREQARRISRLGFNLMRIHHHDSMTWVNPTVIDKTRPDSQTLDAAAMDRLDWLIHCLKEEGVYVWIDLHVGRQLKEGDDLGEGADEVLKRKGELKGFCYFSPRIEALMRESNERYLGHVNPYTRLAYKEDPAVMGVLLTNENDVTHHFGNLMLGDKGNPTFNGIFIARVKEFCEQTGLPGETTWQTWLLGPSKLFLNEQEHRFNVSLLGHLKGMGVRAPAATTNYWGAEGLHSLPALTDGGIVDVHSYGDEEHLGANPRYDAGFLPWIAAGQVYGKPLAITEWNVPYPARDRCTAPLAVMAIACLQGWDAPMLYNYSQRPFGRPDRPDTWSAFYDPALMGLMPAAALAYRQGHVAEARKTYCVKLSREQLFYRGLSPATSAAVRTLTETSKLTLGMPAVKELPWLQETKPAAGVTVVTDPDQDFIPAGQDLVQSDTGEIRRNWVKGIQVIRTPRTQAASGWLGGEAIALDDVTFRVATPKATVVLTSLDGQPIASSKRVLLTAVARAVADPTRKAAYLSEPVRAAVSLRSKVPGLRLVPLAGDGSELPAAPLTRQGDAYTITLPAPAGTHWFLLTAGG